MKKKHKHRHTNYRLHQWLFKNVTTQLYIIYKKKSIKGWVTRLKKTPPF